MCVVSAVTDHFQHEWGTPWIDPGSIFLKPINIPPMPSVLPPLRTISEADWLEYQRLKKAAEEIDQKTNQPDCIKPDLAEWEQRMEEFLIKRGVLVVPTSD